MGGGKEMVSPAGDDQVGSLVGLDIVIFCEGLANDCEEDLSADHCSRFNRASLPGPDFANGWSRRCAGTSWDGPGWAGIGCFVVLRTAFASPVQSHMVWTIF